MSFNTRRTALLLALTAFAAARGDAQVDPEGYVLVETLSVPPDGSVVQSQATLATGVVYKLQASGSDGGGGDAEYDFGGNNNCTPYEPPTDLGIGVDDVTVDGEKTPNWGPYSGDHVYTVDFTGKGARIAVNYHDCIYTDNQGGLVVKVFAPRSTVVALEAENPLGARGRWVWRSNASGLKQWRFDRDTDFLTMRIVLPEGVTPRRFQMRARYALDAPSGQFVYAALDGVTLSPLDLASTSVAGSPGAGWNQHAETPFVAADGSLSFPLLGGEHHLTLRCGPTAWGVEIDKVVLEEVAD